MLELYFQFYVNIQRLLISFNLSPMSYLNLIILSRRFGYKTHDYMSKVKVTLWGQMTKFSNLYLVRAITSQVIIISSWYFVEMFTLICRRVAYKTHDSMSKVKVRFRGQSSKLCNLYLVRAITSQVIVVFSWY